MSKYTETSTSLWIEHDGSEKCPVDRGRRFEVKFRNGDTSDLGGGWDWGRNDQSGDIMAYRYIDTPPMVKPVPTEEHTGGSSSYYTVPSRQVEHCHLPARGEAKGPHETPFPLQV